MLLLVLFSQPPVLQFWSYSQIAYWLNVYERIEYKVISTTYKLLHVTCVISSQYSRAFSIHSINYFSHFPPTTSSLHDYKPLFSACCSHLWKSFLLLFVSLVSLVHHHHPALLCHHALILDRLLTFLMAFSIFVSKRSFSNKRLKDIPSLAIYPFLRLIWNLTTWCLAVTGGDSISECGGLSQPSWLFRRRII